MAKLKLLFVADGRSPIALNWMRYFVQGGHHVHLASMYSCQPELELASVTILPVAFSGTAGQAASSSSAAGVKGRLLQRLATPALRTWLRHTFVPRSLPGAAEELQGLIERLQPDLVHAMRIPYEGMLAGLAYQGRSLPPLLVSVWGNDFTLHAPASRSLGRLTRLCLQQAAALHTDCYRDQPLAQTWGFDANKPAVVLPGAGGLQPEIFYPPQNEPDVPIVINPRGMRAYVRNDTFFRAVPQVLAAVPQARFLCPTMAGAPEAQRWVQRLKLEQSVDLLPCQSREQMAELFRIAQVAVSPSEHDGTPNTLLEAMACGCLPVAGDIESLREWIEDGVNGLLVDPADPAALAQAMITGLQDAGLRQRAREENTRLIARRAAYPAVMAEAQTFYQQLIGIT